MCAPIVPCRLSLLIGGFGILVKLDHRPPRQRHADHDEDKARWSHETQELAMDLAPRATSEELSRALGDAVIRIWGQLPRMGRRAKLYV